MIHHVQQNYYYYNYYYYYYYYLAQRSHDVVVDMPLAISQLACFICGAATIDFEVCQALRT